MERRLSGVACFDPWIWREIWSRGRRKKMAPALTFFLRKDCVSCRVVWLYLLKNKISFTTVDINEGRPVGFSGMSPLGTVPMILDDDQSISGSLAIVLYLAEKYASFAGFGQTPEMRAKVNSVVCWACGALDRDVCHNYINPSLFHQEDSLVGDANMSLISYGKTEVIFHLNTLESHYLSKSKFLCGERETFADSWVALILSSLELLSFDFSPWPNVKTWLLNMKSNCDYVDVSHQHEEKVRKYCYGCNRSVGDIKSV